MLAGDLSYRLQILGSRDLYAGAHSGNHGAGTDILTLGSCGLSLNNSLDQSIHVLQQLLSAEGNLADGAVDDVGLVQTVLDLTSLDFLNSSADVGSHGASIGGGHQALGAQNLTKTANQAHHIGRSNNNVELEPVLLGDLLNQLHAANIVSASSGSFVDLSVLGENQDPAGLAGADYVGGMDLVEKITKENWFEFDVVVASPDMMGVVGRLGKVLGPKGLMPSPKAGTVTPNVGAAVKEIKAGKVEYRLDKTNIIHCPIGKVSFGAEKLMENMDTLVKAVVKAKPAAAKGQYIRSCTVVSTMGPGVKVSTAKYL